MQADNAVEDRGI